MKRTQLLLVIAGIAALALGGTAIAAKSHSHATRAAAPPVGHMGHGHGDDLDAAATYLGTSTSDLLSALQGGKTLAAIADSTSGKSASGLVAALVAHEKQELADAVAAGRITQAQSDQAAAMLQQRFQDLVSGTLPAGMPHRPFDGGPMHGAMHGAIHGGLDAAAAYLGISEDALVTQLRSGKTLAQVANAASGKSASGLIDALVADATKRLGANTPSDLRQHITDLVNGTMPRFEHRMDGAPMMGPGGGVWAPAPMGRNS